MGKMKELSLLIEEEFVRVFERNVTASEAQTILEMIVRHDMTVLEAITYLFDKR